nr:PREDICTED: uncharacterized protein LOC109039946 [Bemisia tabaci]XP_018911224.1 PREDICTED: uncharacterized protein LOC109039946 [Bemisia tabaci]
MRRRRSGRGCWHVGPPLEIIAPQPPLQPQPQPEQPPLKPAPASIPPQEPRCLGEITISSEEEPPSTDTSRTGEITISSEEEPPSTDTSRTDAVD